jgi:ribonucleoside-diphosphate reductase alpha chain
METFLECARIVLEQRYLKRTGEGVVETPAGMLERVATAVAEPARGFGQDPGSWAERFLTRMQALEFLPNSPTLMNAGIPGGQLAACFVLPLQDDLDSIFGSLSLAARIQQSGGGTGFSFSALRPRNDLVRSTGGISSGPVSFIELFDHATRVIRAGGRRRGANMAVLRIDHPDIELFINAKRSSGALDSFNLSVGVTNAFFDALRAGERYPLRNPHGGAEVRQLDPNHLLDEIAHAAWACGDPGMLFLDEINRSHVTPAFGEIEATNPCGEQPLLPYESCILGSLNVAAFARGGEVDWDRFKEAVRDAVVFLDNVIEVNRYPTKKIEDATRRTRKIGLGIMGWADLLATIGLPYDGDEARRLGARLAAFLSTEGRHASVELAAERGSFPAFKESVWPARGFAALRNATVTCIAPTGTISLLAGCSSGIEPFFALATRRRFLDDRVVTEVNKLVQRALESLGLIGRDALAEIEESGSLAKAAGIPPEIKQSFKTALEVEPAAHVRMQAAFQAQIDAAVSKTVNLPAHTQPDLVKQLFLMGHELHLKGLTVYRYGSRGMQPLSLVHEEAQADCRECAA